MSGAVRFAYGNIAATALASALTTVITATIAGSILYAYAHINTPGTGRAFDSNSTGTGTWQQVYDSNSFDGTGNAYWVCLNPSAGTTNVRVTNGGTNSHFSVCVIEITGIANAGAIYQATDQNNQAAVTSWTSLTLTVPGGKTAFGVGNSYQGGGATPLGSMGVGFTAVSGTGLTLGNVSNAVEGDCTVLGTQAAIPPGALAATGSWASAVGAASYFIAFEEAAPPPPAGPSLMGHGIFVNA